MFKKILFFGRKNDIYSRNILSFIKRKSKIVKVIWSTNPEDKLKLKNLLKHNYDYIFSFRSFIILRKNLIKKAKYAAINFHPGPPEFRGIGCLNFAIFKNAKFYGVTAHVMDKKIDYGKIINVNRFEILKRDNVDSLLNKTHKKLLSQARKIIDLLSKNPYNLNKLIHKSKNEKWSKKITRRAELDEFYKICSGTTKKNLFKKIRATYSKKFKPYFLIHNFKFILSDSISENINKFKNKYRGRYLNKKI